MRRQALLVAAAVAAFSTTPALAGTTRSSALNDAKVGSAKAELIGQRDHSASLIRFSTPESAVPTVSEVTVPRGPAAAVWHPHHKPFVKMTLAELERHQASALARYTYVSQFYLRWWKLNHQRVLSAVAPPSVHALEVATLPVCRATGIRSPESYCWYAAAARWTGEQLVKTRAKIEAAKAAAEAARMRALGGDWAEFACIHRYEGAADAATGNGYYGGLQMDMGFQSTYGHEFMQRWGTANNWPVWAQVTAARRARDSGRGYGPWPNTARMCGLL